MLGRAPEFASALHANIVPHPELLGTARVSAVGCGNSVRYAPSLRNLRL